MSYPLHTPLTAAEADLLAQRHLFLRSTRDDAVFAIFETRAGREAAAEELRATRIARWREVNGLEVGAEQSA